MCHNEEKSQEEGSILKYTYSQIVSTVIQLANFKRPEVNIEFINEELNEEVERIFFEQRTGKIALQYKDKDKSFIFPLNSRSKSHSSLSF